MYKLKPEIYYCDAVGYIYSRQAALCARDLRLLGLYAGKLTVVEIDKHSFQWGVEFLSRSVQSSCDLLKKFIHTQWKTLWRVEDENVCPNEHLFLILSLTAKKR